MGHSSHVPKCCLVAGPATEACGDLSPRSMVSARKEPKMPKKGSGRIGAAKIRDAEYLEWLCATLKEGCLTASMIHSLAWEKFRHRGVKREGTGGAIRRLLQQHCSTCKWFKEGHA